MTASAPALDEATIRVVLDTIVDPCSRAAGAPAGISEMGMIPDIALLPGAGNQTNVYVHLIVTHPFCMMSSLFVKEISERVGALDGAGEVEVNLDPGTLWTPDMMTPEYAERLEVARARRRAEFAAKKAA